ncbi:MAG: nuclear transport factor 2 family protein [Mycobacteriaceae bacterium]
MSTSEIATVLAWHDALAAGDVDTLLDLSSDDVEVASVAGATQGIAALREWAQHSAPTLVPGRMFVHNGVIVVEQQASSAEQQLSHPIATSFRVVHDQVTSVFRHDNLQEALEATGLGVRDEIGDTAR